MPIRKPIRALTKTTQTLRAEGCDKVCCAFDTEKRISEICPKLVGGSLAGLTIICSYYPDGGPFVRCAESVEERVALELMEQP